MTTRSLLALSFSLTAAACSAEAPDAEPVGSTSQEIIGGFAATAAKLDAIGALASPDGEGGYFPWCSGTLIAAKAVLTAEHCIQNLSEGDVFLIGADAKAPKQVLRVVGSTAETLITGGTIGLGSDIAVVHLGEEAVGVTPFGLGTLSEADLGKRFIVAGYGIQNNSLDAGTRRVGAETFRGLTGTHLANVFGSFEAFVADVADAFPSSVITAEELVGSSRVDLQACKLEYSIVSPK